MPRYVSVYAAKRPAAPAPITITCLSSLVGSCKNCAARDASIGGPRVATGVLVLTTAAMIVAIMATTRTAKMIRKIFLVLGVHLGISGFIEIVEAIESSLANTLEMIG